MNKIIGNPLVTPMRVPDWNQTDERKSDYIKNKPDITIYATKEELNDVAIKHSSIVVKAVATDICDTLTDLAPIEQTIKLSGLNGWLGRLVIRDWLNINNLQSISLDGSDTYSATIPIQDSGAICFSYINTTGNNTMEEPMFTVEYYRNINASELIDKAWFELQMCDIETKKSHFVSGDEINVVDNTEYTADGEINTLTVLYPETDFICSLYFTLASSGTITVTLPESKYIGETPEFKNGETWELSIKNGVVVGGKVL